MPESPHPNARRILLHTPLCDILLRRTPGRLDARAAIASFQLPDELESLALRVARQTRLHRSERVAVAQDLAEHLREGLDDGASPESLLADFGDERNTARLIRRSMIRKRSHLARVPRYAVKGSALLSMTLFTAFLLAWIIMGTRIWFDSPNPTKDYVLQLNAPIMGIPAEDRAWPGLESVSAELDQLALARSKDGESRGSELLASFGIDADQIAIWPTSLADPEAAAAFMSFNREAGPIIEQVRELAERPALGIEMDMAENISLHQIQFTHLGIIHSNIRLLLLGDLQIAVRTNQTERTLADLKTLLELARLMRQQSFLISQLTAINLETNAFKAVQNILAQRPDLFENDQLVELSNLIALPDERLSISMKDERLYFEDVAQHVYGSNGQLLPEVFTVIRDFGISPPLGMDSFAIAPFALAAAPSRSEALDTWHRYLDHQEAAMASNPQDTKMLSPEELGRYQNLLPSTHEWDDASTFNHYHQYASEFPVNIFLPAFDHLPEFVRKQRLERDAAILAIALEQWRREHGDWPEMLEQLVPNHLEELPSDQFDEDPLRYLTGANGPFIYSVGLDKVHDFGDEDKDLILWEAGTDED